MALRAPHAKCEVKKKITKSPSVLQLMLPGRPDSGGGRLVGELHRGVLALLHGRHVLDLPHPGEPGEQRRSSGIVRGVGVSIVLQIGRLPLWDFFSKESEHFLA